MKKQKTFNEETLKEIIRRVIEACQPEKIIFFGSSARGEMGPNSDVDLLVVKTGVHRRKTAKQIYRNLRGVGFAVDVIVVTPENIQRYRKCPALIIQSALEEGKTVYAT